MRLLYFSLLVFTRKYFTNFLEPATKDIESYWESEYSQNLFYSTYTLPSSTLSRPAILSFSLKFLQKNSRTFLCFYRFLAYLKELSDLDDVLEFNNVAIVLTVWLVNFLHFGSFMVFFIQIYGGRAYTCMDLHCPVNNLRYVGAHNMQTFKNDGWIKILIFPRFFMKVLDYSILDHIYIYI